MPEWQWVLTVSALLFALVNGVNDGATLVALGVRASRMQPLWAVLLPAFSIVAAPALLGTRVASTFLDRLVSFEGHLAESTFIAVVGALATIAFLGWKGLPTSLTVAMLGALVGAGVGQGLDVHWGTIISVLLMALATPVIGFAMAFLVSRLAMRLSVQDSASRVIENAHAGAFAIQCLAYGVNDGQKILAVLVVATGGFVRGAIAVSLIDLTIIAGVFALGTILGMRKYAKTLVLDVFPIRRNSAVAAEIAAATSVLATGLIGSPVSTSQTVVASVVGSGAHEGVRRVRWGIVVRIGQAWIYTFPMTLLLGAVLAWLLSNT